MVLVPASDCCCNQDLNNLNGSSGGGSHRWAAKKSVKYLPRNETFKAPHDLGFTLAFFHAACCIGFCLLMPSQLPHVSANKSAFNKETPGGVTNE